MATLYTVGAHWCLAPVGVTTDVVFPGESHPCLQLLSGDAVVLPCQGRRAHDGCLNLSCHSWCFPGGVCDRYSGLM